MNELYPIIRRARRPLLPVNEGSPSPQPFPPGEGAAHSAAGEDLRAESSGDVQNAPTLDAFPPLPGGEGRGEGERALPLTPSPPLVSVAEVLEGGAQAKGKRGGKAPA
jgi:hypothetical protein